MSIDALNYISNQLEEAGIDYEFGEWSSDPVPEPYFVGEYSESTPISEDGEQDTTFILTGTARKWILLEQAKAIIEKLFSKVTGLTAILPNGNGIAVFYDNAFNVPTGDAELKRIQINLLVKEWSVN
jgi:hypothetical protein